MSRDYWIWDIKIGKTKKKIKTYMDRGVNPGHKAVRFAKKVRKGDRFYLDNGSIVRHRIDIIGSYKIKSFRSNDL